MGNIETCSIPTNIEGGLMVDQINSIADVDELLKMVRERDTPDDISITAIAYGQANLRESPVRPDRDLSRTTLGTMLDYTEASADHLLSMDMKCRLYKRRLELAGENEVDFNVYKEEMLHILQINGEIGGHYGEEEFKILGLSLSEAQAIEEKYGIGGLIHAISNINFADIH